MIKGRLQTLGVVTWFVVLHHLREMVEILFVPEVAEVSTSILVAMLKLSAFALYDLALESCHVFVMMLASSHVKFTVKSKPISKWRGIKEGFCTWGKGKEAQDHAYSMRTKGNSAVSVLSDMVGYLVFLCKLAGLTLLLLDFIGVDIYANIIFVVLSIGLAAAWSTCRLSDSVSALLPMALTCPFYVGEIISLSNPGDNPADKPTTSVTGFVEAITWTHVCLRDFKKKQVFIPLPEFQRLIVANWTRRPAKLCYWYLCISSQSKMVSPSPRSRASSVRGSRRMIRSTRAATQRPWSRAS